MYTRNENDSLSRIVSSVSHSRSETAITRTRRDTTRSLPDAQTPPGETRLVWRLEDLLKGREELRIEHQGQLYRLRLTPAGKLILTK